MLPGDLGKGNRTAESTDPVVVGVDGSRGATGAAQWAAAVAERFGAPLLIVHAKPARGHDPSGVIAELEAAGTAVLRESVEAILSCAEHAVREHLRDLRVSTARVGRPVDEALVGLSDNARLIVLGGDELSLGTAILVGSTTTAVASHSRCPVVAWRGDATAPTRQPVVLGIDHDHDSRGAVRAAFEFADRLGVGILAVHTWTTRRPAGDVSIPFLIDWDRVEEDARQHLSDVLSFWIKLYPDVDVTEVVDPGKPSRALLRAAEDAQLIVIGNRGRGLLAGVLLGSTGLNLLHHSAIPVMICRSEHAETTEAPNN
jgi:nucleotide-binding universal stress UspA family protein